MGYRLFHNVIAIELLVTINIHGSFIRRFPRFVKDSLTSAQFTVNGC